MNGFLIFLVIYAAFGAVFAIIQFCNPIMDERNDDYGYDRPATFTQRIKAAIFVSILWPVIVWAVLTRGW